MKFIGTYKNFVFHSEVIFKNNFIDMILVYKYNLWLQIKLNLKFICFYLDTYKMIICIYVMSNVRNHIFI